MKFCLTLPLDRVAHLDVGALCAELRRLDLPGVVDLVEWEARAACQEGRAMRSLDIPVEYDLEALPTWVQDDWRRLSRAKAREYHETLPVLAAFFGSYADVLERVQEHERRALAWWEEQVDAKG